MGEQAVELNLIEREWKKFREKVLADDVAHLAPEQIEDVRLMFFSGARAAVYAIFEGDGGFATLFSRLTRVRAELDAMIPAVGARGNEGRDLMAKASRCPELPPRSRSSKCAYSTCGNDHVPGSELCAYHGGGDQACERIHEDRKRSDSGEGLA